MPILRLGFWSGKFGKDLVLDFQCIPRHGYKNHLSEGMGPSETYAKVLFCAVLFGMGERRRRFAAEADAYPGKIFELCRMSEVEVGTIVAEIVLMPNSLKAWWALPPSEPSRDVYVQITDFLKELAVFLVMLQF